MTNICGNCGQEVDGVVIDKPGILEFWKKERSICQRCAYNKKFGTYLNVEQWTAKINSLPNTQINSCDTSYGRFLNNMAFQWRVEHTTLTNPTYPNNMTYKVEKGYTGRILLIECPPGHIITICGIEQSCVDPEDFAKAPFLYTVPHEFSILCFDADNNELPFDSIIMLEKELSSKALVPLETVLYGDLSLKIGTRLKRKEERYFFQKGKILYGGERLVLTVVKSGMSIDRVEFFIRCDFFTKMI